MTTTLLNDGTAYRGDRGWFNWNPPPAESHAAPAPAHAQMPEPAPAIVGEQLPAAPFVSGSSTSHDAALAIAPVAGKQAARVLAFLRNRGAHGATRAEIASALNLGAQSVAPRVLELFKSGLARETTATRDTASGRAAAIIVATGGADGELFT